MKSRLFARCRDFCAQIENYKDEGIYPYFRVISSTSGTEVEVEGRRLLMVSSNDYLGLSHDPQVIEKTVNRVREFGTGTGGSRLLCGNLALHHELEERLARFVGKEKAMVFSTGFTTNLGVVTAMLGPRDVILFDREIHASLLDSCQLTKARLVPFHHNDAEDARNKLRKITLGEENIILLITEGVFSMSGTIVDLPGFVALKAEFPHLYLYLDDAHGLGILGDGGRGVARLFSLETEVDFIMGTFSKTFGSIGGFVACNAPDIAEYLRHKARTMIFSAALPAGNVATVLACLDILEQQPERIDAFKSNIARVKHGYQRLGLPVSAGESPIIPVSIGDEEAAIAISRELFAQGIFALPVIYPAVARKKAIIRTTFMSSHSCEQIDSFLLILETTLRRHGLVSGPGTGIGVDKKE